VSGVSGARLIALPLALVAGVLLAVGVAACGDEKKHKPRIKTKTVTVQEKASPTTSTGALDPDAAKKAAEAGIPPGASASPAVSPPAGATGVPSGAIPSGGIPPGVLPSGINPEVSGRVKVKVDSSRRVSRNLDVCRPNRGLCRALDQLPGVDTR
jgi:hypothetical protein